jgi:hypothetical protein
MPEEETLEKKKKKKKKISGHDEWRGGGGARATDGRTDRQREPKRGQTKKKNPMSSTGSGGCAVADYRYWGRRNATRSLHASADTDQATAERKVSATAIIGAVAPRRAPPPMAKCNFSSIAVVGGVAQSTANRCAGGGADKHRNFEKSSARVLAAATAAVTAGATALFVIARTPDSAATPSASASVTLVGESGDRGGVRRHPWFGHRAFEDHRGRHGGAAVDSDRWAARVADNKTASSPQSLRMRTRMGANDRRGGGNGRGRRGE